MNSAKSAEGRLRLTLSWAAVRSCKLKDWIWAISVVPKRIIERPVLPEADNTHILPWVPGIQRSISDTNRSSFDRIPDVSSAYASSAAALNFLAANTNRMLGNRNRPFLEAIERVIRTAGTGRSIAS